jgi:hypothetical protein
VFEELEIMPEVAPVKLCAKLREPR